MGTWAQSLNRLLLVPVVDLINISIICDGDGNGRPDTLPMKYFLSR